MLFSLLFSISKVITLSLDVGALNILDISISGISWNPLL